MNYDKCYSNLFLINYDKCCQLFREGRKGIDVVNDGVENSLMREVDNIKSCQDRMKRTLEQVNHQLGVNRYKRYAILFRLLKMACNDDLKEVGFMLV